MEETYKEKWQEKIKLLQSTPYPDDPSKITIPHIMAKEFPDIEYEAMMNQNVPYMTNIKVKYHAPEEIKLAIESRIIAIYGVTVEEF